MYKVFFILVGRTEPNLDDVGLAFNDLGISLAELEDYVSNIGVLPFAHDVVSYPTPKPCNLQFPKSNCRELQHREDDNMPMHLPAIYPGINAYTYIIVDDLNLFLPTYD